MKAIFSRSLIPAVLVIAALAAGTGLLAGYIDMPCRAPQAVAQTDCDGCPLKNTEACPRMAAASADPQVHAAPCGATAAEASPCAGMAATASPCTGMAASETPCTGTEGCPMPCCQKAGEAPAAGCTMAKPQTGGCPFMSPSSEAASPCGTSGCTQEK
jgi:hypothetical protein